MKDKITQLPWNKNNKPGKKNNLLSTQITTARIQKAESWATSSGIVLDSLIKEIQKTGAVREGTIKVLKVLNKQLTINQNERRQLIADKKAASQGLL